MLPSAILHTHLWTLVQVFSVTDSRHVESLVSYPHSWSFKYRFRGFPLAPLNTILWDQGPCRCSYSKPPGGPDLQPKLKLSRESPNCSCVHRPPTREGERGPVWPCSIYTGCRQSLHLGPRWSKRRDRAPPAFPSFLSLRESPSTLSVLTGNLRVLRSFPPHWVLNHCLTDLKELGFYVLCSTYNGISVY